MRCSVVFVAACVSACRSPDGLLIDEAVCAGWEPLYLEAWGDFAFTNDFCAGRIHVHRLSTMELVGAWTGLPQDRVRPVGDRSGDGVPEIILLRRGEEETPNQLVAWVERLPDGDEDPVDAQTWSARLGSTSPSLDVYLADLDADGRQEPVLWAIQGDSQAWRIPTGMTGERPVEELEPLFAEAGFELQFGLVSEDLDGDGTLELISRSPYAFQRGPLGSSFEPEYVLDEVMWIDQHPADLTGDGVFDVVLKDQQDAAYVLEGGARPASLAELSIGWQEPTGRLHEAYVLADINGDGRADVVVVVADEARIFLGPLSGFMTRDDADLVVEGTVIQPAGDADGDGRDDLMDFVDEGGGAYSLELHLASELFP